VAIDLLPGQQHSQLKLQPSGVRGAAHAHRAGDILVLLILFIIPSIWHLVALSRCSAYLFAIGAIMCDESILGLLEVMLMSCIQHVQRQLQPKQEVNLLKFESNSRAASASAKRRDLSGAGGGQMSSGVRIVGAAAAADDDDDA
jgi:hypothetical protein